MFATEIIFTDGRRLTGAPLAAYDTALDRVLDAIHDAEREIEQDIECQIDWKQVDGKIQMTVALDELDLVLDFLDGDRTATGPRTFEIEEVIA